MKQQEFVTLYGKAIIERDVLFLRSFYVPFTRTNFFRIGYELVFLLILTYWVIAFTSGDDPKRFISVLGWSFIVLLRTPRLYDVLLKRSYANRIPLHRIKDVTSVADSQGLHIFVKLHLANGRYRKICFRTMEKQYESFIEAISHHLEQTQFA